MLSARREAPCHSERARAALAWAEAPTRVADDPLSCALYAESRRHFDETELVHGTFAVIAIDGWNRLAIPFQNAGWQLRAAAAEHEQVNRLGDPQLSASTPIAQLQ